MKKTIVLLLTALLVFTGCSGEEPVEYVVYSDSASATVLADSSNANADSMEIRSSRSLDIYHSQRQNSENKNALKSKLLSLSGNERTYSLKRSQVSGLANCKNEIMKKYGVVDQYEYRTDTEYLIADFRPTGELLFYSDLSSTNCIRGSFSESDARTAAVQWIANLYGNEIADQYTFTRTSVSESGYIHAIYTRYICGYPTLDKIQIAFHGNGKLRSINALQYDLFTSLEDSITTKKIDAAKAALMERIGGDWEPGEISLAVGADGKCYLQVYGSWNESAQTAPVYYINVN